MMGAHRKTASDVRAEAYRLAREAADQREADGDPEGSGVIRDLAGAIRRITIVEGQGGTRYGDPLPNYVRGDKAWPDLWRLPEPGADADLFDNAAHIADDILLREAVHVWDNLLRVPGSFEGVQGGMISAHARLVVGSGRCADLEKAADAIRDAWLGQARQAADVMRDGWPE